MRRLSRPTILLLSATAGFGHVKAGKSLAVALCDRFPNWDIVHENIGDFSDAVLRNSTERGWLVVSTTPILRSVYSFLHRKILSSDRLCRIIAPLFYGIGRNLAKVYGSRDVRAVIALHPAAVAAAVGWRREREFVVSAVATDLIVHGLQSLPGVDIVFADRGALFVSCAARQLKSSGGVFFSGLPIEKKFFQDRRKVGDQLENVVVSFGALGLRGSRNVRKLVSIMSAETELKFSVVCGNNPSFRQKLIRAVSDAGILERVSVFGFVDDMQEKLFNACLFLGKPGGISIGEALASGVPIGILDFLPGQEEANIEALRRMGCSTTVFELTGHEGTTLHQQVMSQVTRLPRWRASTSGGIEAIVSHLGQVLTEDARCSKTGHGN